MYRKVKTKIMKISLISIILFLCMAVYNSSQAVTALAAVAIKGFAGIQVVTFQYLVAIIGYALNELTNSIVGVEEGASPLAAVLFNQSKNINATFFTEWGSVQSDVVGQIAINIGKYYYIIRNLSIAILLVVLLYIGIRMAISTVASDQAKYKTMLFNWFVSLALVFVLHYIIIITFAVNDTIVNVLYKSMGDSVGNDGKIMLRFKRNSCTYSRLARGNC